MGDIHKRDLQLESLEKRGLFEKDDNNKITNIQNKKVVTQNEEIKESKMKEYEIQETLIKGYQKENEKLMNEIRKYKTQLNEKMHELKEEQDKTFQLQTTILKQNDKVLVSDNEPDIKMIGELNGG